MNDWATLNRMRDDIRLRAEQVHAISVRLREAGAKLDAMAKAVETLEEDSRLRGRRKRRRRRRGEPKPPTVVDVAIEILREHGGALPCIELARMVRARGADSGNNERSLRMSAGKGRRLIGLPGDRIALA